MEKFQLFTNGIKGDCLGLFKEAEEKMGFGMVGGNDWDWWGWLLMVVHQGPRRELSTLFCF